MKTLRTTVTLVLTGLFAAGCSDLTFDTVPTIAPLPTLAPSQVSTATQTFDESEQTPISLTQMPSPTVTAPLAATSALPGGSLPTPEPEASESQSPVIEYFMASPEQAAAGEAVVLVWSTQGGTSATIYRLDMNGQPGESLPVALEGSMTVYPEMGLQPETYILTLTDGTNVLEERLTIDVTCGFTWFFSPPPDDSCPTVDLAGSPAVVQEFESGKMVLIEELDLIVVLFEDLITESDQSKPAWLSMQNPYEEGMAEAEPAVPAPDGKFYPHRGFGSVWQYTATVKDRLGWAVGGEVPFTTTHQSGISEAGDEFYFTNTQGEVIRLVPDGAGWLVAGYQ